MADINPADVELPADELRQPTMEELTRGHHIATGTQSKCDNRLWGEDVIEGATVVALTTYIVRNIVDIQHNDLVDEDLWEDFTESFYNWSEEMFFKAYDPAVKRLRSVLRERGIAVTRAVGVIASRGLHALLSTETLPEWDPQHLQQQTFNPRSKQFRIQGEKKVQFEEGQPGGEEQPGGDTQSEGDAQPGGGPQPEQTIQGNGLQETIERQRRATSEVSLRRPLTTGSQEPSSNLVQQIGYLQFPQQYDSEGEETIAMPTTGQDEYFAIPPLKIRKGVVEVKMVTDFRKLWDTSDNYGGEPYDLLEDKYKTFLDVARTVGCQRDQFHELFPYILKGQAKQFHQTFLRHEKFFRREYKKLDENFNTSVNRSQYATDWTSTNWSTIQNDPDLVGKGPLQVLDGMFRKLQLCQRALGHEYSGERHMHMQVTMACRGYVEFEMALQTEPFPTQVLYSKLRASLQATLVRKNTSYVNSYENIQREAETHLVDRQYGGTGGNRRRPQYPQGRGNSNSRPYNNSGNRPYNNGGGNNRPHNSSTGTRWNNSYKGRGNYKDSRNGATNAQGEMVCNVCHKPNCWSTNHSPEDRARAQRTWLTDNPGASREEYAMYLAETEGIDDYGDIEDPENLPDENPEQSESYYYYLANTSFIHNMTGEAKYGQETTTPSDQFTFRDRYSEQVYQGIIPDTGAAHHSTCGKGQYLALKKIDPNIVLDETTAGQASIVFGAGRTVKSIGTVTVHTEAGTYTFHVLDTETPFLACVQDMTANGVIHDNIERAMIHKTSGKRTPTVMKWGHPWFHLSPKENAAVMMTEKEMRMLHRRFNHPAWKRLYDLLHKAGHDVDPVALQAIQDMCHYCQLNGPPPKRFKFKLKDDHDFNYEVFVDVCFAKGEPVLHVVDSGTGFNAAGFLPSQDARTVYQTFAKLWIHTYLGPPDIITPDAGTAFEGDFVTSAKNSGSRVNKAPTEAHWTIGKVERAHSLLMRAYDIIHAEIGSFTPKEAVLQMAVKCLNDTAGPSGIVPTLLVFGAYPRMLESSPPTPDTVSRAKAADKAMKELRKIHAQRQVADALASRNGPDTTKTRMLPLGSEVVVYRENEGWDGPYPVAVITDSRVTITTPAGPSTFAITHVKPYYREADPDTSKENSTHPRPMDPDFPPPAVPQPRKTRPRGRPKGSRNKKRDDDGDYVPSVHFMGSYDVPLDEVFDKEFVSDALTAPVITKKDISGAFTADTYVDDCKLINIYLSKLEEQDTKLALELRKQGIITTPGAPFEASDKSEIDDLLARGVFEFVQYDPKIHGSYRLFKARMVHALKDKQTQPREKSRLVVQGYNDEGKEMILTQSPTIQRVSQRLLVALAACMITSDGACFEHNGVIYGLNLRDISQAYTQSHTKLLRDIYCTLPKELRHLYPEGTIMKVILPLYGIAEAGVHWFATYQKHHKEQLSMITSTYDPCLLVTHNTNDFGLVGMQTDDTLFLGSQSFTNKEEAALQQAKFMAKPITSLSPDEPLRFNGCTLIMDTKLNCLHMRQKGQGARLATIDINDPECQQRYVEQRARGAYISSICQPEACFDLSTAAQVQQPTAEDIKRLSKRIQWQMDHQDRGLTMVPLDLSTAKLMVFTDGSFANNGDYSSQIGYITMLVNEDFKGDHFTIRGNVLHYTSVKSKRVARSTLASEILGMMAGFDTTVSLATTLGLITTALNVPDIPIVICTDSYSLYECLIKLGMTIEKRLMIDVMALRESYERREISEIRWVNGKDNPADAMTKATPNGALETLITTNELMVRVEGYVQRPSVPKE